MKFLAKLLCTSVLFFGVVGTANADLAVQFTRDVTTPTGTNGHAAVGFDGTNFWVARWNAALSTDVSRITPAGALVDTFQIAGLSGTRSLTWDGTQFWAGNATTTLRRVDPVTKTVTATVTVPIAARYVTYDPTANSGAGGFWIGNFDTDIVQVSMTGATLATIPAATTAAMGGRYGIAFDNVSGPTPFLWVFYQTGGPSTASLGIIDLPSGTPRAQVQNIATLVPDPASLAGGAFLTSGVTGPARTLLLLAQGTPDTIVGLTPAPSVPVELMKFSID